MPELNTYLAKLLRLNRAPTKYGRAPHKPVLLLTLLEMIDKGFGNCFAPDVDLVGIFQENWQLLVHTPNQADFTQPYYYLQSEKAGGEPIWQLVALPGCQMNAHIKSVHRLSQIVSHGAFQPELYTMLSIPENRALVRAQLLNCYFPEFAAAFLQTKQSGAGYYHELEAWVLNEPGAAYKAIRVQNEEEMYVRGGLFKRLVPQVYRQTCCMSGMQLNSTFGHIYIDACHIVPFSVSHDDRVANGLALCPNLHRAFDRGLITVGEDHRIILSGHIREDAEHHYSLGKLAGQLILLPGDKHAWPDQELLDWHRKNCFVA